MLLRKNIVMIINIKRNNLRESFLKRVHRVVLSNIKIKNKFVHYFYIII